MKPLFAGLTLALLARHAPSQVLYGSVVGAVTDPSGATIPAVVVTMTDPSNRLVREVRTDDAGRYSIIDLPPGAYDLHMAKPAFGAYRQTGIAITMNTVTRVNAILEIGPATETITITAGTTVERDKADVHVNLDKTAVQNLTLGAFRNYQRLTDLVPGATPGRLVNAVNDTPGRALVTNVNGVNRNNNRTWLDGAVNVFLWLPHNVAYVSPMETIEAVNVSTNNFDAEQGMAGGMAVTVSTRSGSNEFHGAAFAFYDNQDLRARNFFLGAASKPRSITNIDGAVAGGPIVRDRLFFFGSWEGDRERAGRNLLLSVGSAPLREGDFRTTGTTIYDPNTGNSDGTNRTPFSGNVIPLNRQSAITRKMEDLVPLPNRPGEFANYSVSGTQGLDRDSFDAKINWNRGARDSLWGKWSIMNAEITAPFGLGAAGGPCICDSGVPGVGRTRVNLAAIGASHIVSPRLLIDTVMGFTRMGQVNIPPDFGRNFGSDVLGIPGTNGPDPRQSGLPAFSIGSSTVLATSPSGGFTGLGNLVGGIPGYRNDQTWTFAANTTWNHGGHEIRFGFEGIQHHLNHWQPETNGTPRGSFSFSGGATALNGGPSANRFNGYADFLLGLPTGVNKTLQYIKMTALEYQLGWYWRDRWQVTSKFTVSMGVRYELYPLMSRASDGIERYDQTTNLVYIGGIGGQPRNAGVTTSKKLFAPRLGLAYRLDEATVIRAGYGISFDPMPLARPLRGSYPLIIGAGFSAPNSYQPFDRIEEGIPEICCPVLTAGVLALPSAVDMRTPPKGPLKRGYIESWNLTVERKLAGGFVSSIGYVGTQTVRSLVFLDINAAAPGTGNAGRPAAQFGRITSTFLLQGGPNANYHSLQATVQRRLTAGLLLRVAYTYSKAINWTDDDGFAPLAWNYAPILLRNRAQAGYNIPHNFELAYSYELPAGKGKRWAQSGAMQAIIGGWQVSGFFSSYQGQPFNVTAAATSLNAQGNIQTADQVLPDVKKLGNVGPGTTFYDPLAFQAVTEARFGNSGRNILRGPGVVNTNLSLLKTFRLDERRQLMFRVEAYNLTNTPHFNNPANNVSDPASFLSISSAQADERQFRCGLRLAF